MQPQVRYVKSSDGTRLAVATVGEGQPLVIVRPSFGISLDGAWEIPEMRRNLEHLAKNRKVVLYDCRGVGLSSRDVEDLSLPALERDLEAVVDGVDSTSADLLAMTMAGPHAISFAAHHPDRVRRLVLVNSGSRGRDIGVSSELRSLRHLIEENWELYLRTQAIVMLGFNEVARLWAERQASDMNQEVCLRGFVDSEKSDVTDLLPSVQCPTLVMHGHEQGMPVEVARELAAAIPNARLLTHAQKGATPLSGDWDSGLGLAAAFLDEGAIEGRSESGGRPTVLSPREVEVLRLLAAGRSTSEIGTELALSRRTVERHIANIYRKIDARNRAQATAFAFERGLAGRS